MYIFINVNEQKPCLQNNATPQGLINIYITNDRNRPSFLTP